MTTCVIGTGTPDREGYLRAGHNVYAHRRAYEESVGPIPPGMVVHHVCENKLCVNPDHLELHTNSDHSCLHKGTLGLTPEERRQRRLAQMRAYTRRWRERHD